MSRKLAGWQATVYYDAPGATATTLIDKNVVDIDPGVSFDFVDQPSRGDGTSMPQTDEQPVLRKAAPKFKLEYHDTDAHMAALLAVIDAEPPTPKAILMKRKLSGKVMFDGDCYLEASASGAQLKEGQPVEFTCHPTGAVRRWTTA